jgi:hypothetical protein
MSRTITGGVLLAAWALGLLPVALARGAPITLTFANLKSLEGVSDYYNGGMGTQGTGPGPAFGVTFSANALVLTNNTSYVNAPSPPEVMLLANVQQPAAMPISATMDVANGFNGDLFFFYGSIAANAGTLQVFSGLDGQGMMLGSMNLANTSGMGVTTAVFIGPLDLSFMGVAHSAVFTGANNQLVFDNITFNSVPEPAALGLLTEAALCLLGVLGLHRMVARRRR